MYIIKNAFRCIGRSKGRNVLIGIIALVIAVSACLGLCIRQAAENAKATALDGMSITATVSYDRGSQMQQFGGGRGEGRPSGGFDRDQFASMMGGVSSMTLEEYQVYAAAPSVEDFYYTLTAYFDGTDEFLPVTDEVESEEETEETDESNGMPSDFPMGGMGGMGGKGGMMRFSTGDFTIVGYSSDRAMTAFSVDKTASILEGGTMFEEGTTDLTCVISEELALYNDLAVGDTIEIANPSLETETYQLTITGFYTSEETNDFSMSMFGAGQDPANRIYMSANALQVILNTSEAASVMVEDEYTGREKESTVTGSLSATYVFADTESYYAFETEARELGLDESYTVSSRNVSAFEERLTPLETLSTMAGGFLLVILIIGAVILVVLNIFNVRERKYEVGVLTAMGMKKQKVAIQFMCEILVVTMIAVILGVGIGAVSAVPVTNALLEGQIADMTSQQEQIDMNFGRPGNMGDMFGGGNMPPSFPGMGGGSMPGESVDYITQIDSAMSLTVVFQMMGVGLLLTLVASAASVFFVMRYDPLKILANRD